MADLDVTPGMEHADVAGWIMGALDPVEHRHFRVHLGSCAECQRTVAEFGPAAQKLAAALPAGDLLTDANPPADLQERTLARVQQAAAKGHQATGRAGEATGPAGRTGPARRRPGAWLISVAAAALVAAGAVASFIVTRPAPALAFSIPLHSQNGSAAAQATAHQSSGGWSIQLTARHLKRLGPGQFYECWYASRASRPGHRELITAGTFTVGASGTVSVQMWSAADPRAFPIMQITIESAGNAAQHGTVILSGTAQH
jgi:Anti-sigma-K factor rskA